MSVRCAKTLGLLSAAALLLVHSPGAAALVDANFTETPFVVVASEITGIEWAPDGSNRLFVIRKGGQVRIVKDGVLLPTPFATETVYTNSECGLIGMAFDPGFVTNGYVYFFVTASSSEQQIIRYTAVGDTGNNRTVIVPGLPTIGQNHDGGAVGFGPDGMLYWAIGDQGNGTGVDADLTTLAAKVGRAHPNGLAPVDNPFFDGAGPNNDYIWARGFRNPYTFTWRPETEQLWSNTVGTSYEQVFVVGSGTHAGWNDYECNQPAGFMRPVICYQTNNSLVNTITAASRSAGVATFTTAASDHRNPVGTKVTITGVSDTSLNGTGFISAVPSPNTFQIAQAGPNATSAGGTATSLNIGGAITGGAFLESTAVPAAYRGDFFFGDFNTGNIVRADILPGGPIVSVDVWATGLGQALDMDVGPDGNLYIARYNGTIVRMAYNATAQGLVVSRRFLRTSEGSVAAFAVRLAMAPPAGVNVTVARTAGDTDLSVTQGASLTFTPANWSTPQIVHVAAAQDAESVDSVATITVSSPGLASEDVVVRATSSPVVSPPLAPSSLVAQAISPTNVSLTWSASSGATHYDIERSSQGMNFLPLTTVQSLSYSDTTVVASTAYLYRVRATNGEGASNFGNVDLATTVVFMNDPVVAQVTIISAVHVVQLREAVGAVRVLAQLPDEGWTDTPISAGVTPVRKIHVEELRSTLGSALSALSRPSLNLTDPTLTTATLVKAAHVQELRNAVK